MAARKSGTGGHRETRLSLHSGTVIQHFYQGTDHKATTKMAMDRNVNQSQNWDYSEGAEANYSLGDIQAKECDSIDNDLTKSEPVMHSKDIEAMKCPYSTDCDSNELTKSEPVMHGKLVQEIEGELTCTICLGMFVEPKVLPCLHTYCKKCVERIAQHSNSIVCPQCREKHTLPSGRVDKLLTSFTFTNLVKLLEVHKADSAKNLVCENGLDTNPAVARCIDCQAYLCKSCSQTHRRMLATKQHKVFSLDEIRSKGEKCFQKPRHCPIHENETLKLYCRTCSKTICGDCTYVDHRSHQYVFIKDVQEELKHSLREKVVSMRRLAGETKNKKENAQKVVEEHGTKVASIRTHVDRTFGELAELVRTCHTKVLHDLDQQAKMRKKVHTTNVEEAELAHARLTSIVTFIERLLQSSNACEISTMANYTFDQCKKLEANPGGAVEESCNWTLDGVEKSKGCLQGVAIRQVIPPAHNKGHGKLGTSKHTRHSQQQQYKWPHYYQ